MTNDAWEPDPSRGEYLPPADPNVTCSPELRTRVMHEFEEYHRRRAMRRAMRRRIKVILVAVALFAAAFGAWMYFGR